MIKTTGLEFKQFYDDPAVWTDETYSEDLEIYINGILDNGEMDLLSISDSDKVKICAGIIVYPDKSEFVDFCGMFRKWRKKQTTAVLTVECSKEKAQILEAEIKRLGGKII